jgi:hypothetical protein
MVYSRKDPGTYSGRVALLSVTRAYGEVISMTASGTSCLGIIDLYFPPISGTPEKVWEKYRQWWDSSTAGPFQVPRTQLKVVWNDPQLGWLQYPLPVWATQSDWVAWLSDYAEGGSPPLRES